MLTSSHLGRSEALRNGAEEPGGVHRFREYPAYSQPPGGEDYFRTEVTRNENDPSPEITAPEPPEELESVYPGHPIVQNHDLHVPVFVQATLGGGAVGFEEGIVTLTAEEPFVASKDGGIVIDDQDFLACHSRPPKSRGG